MNLSNCIIITGATGGIGKALALQLAKEGHPLVLACRNLQKAEQVKQEAELASGNTDIATLPLNLESPVSIKEFAKSLEEIGATVAVLVNNAGIMCRNYRITEFGEETTFAVNYFGPLRLTMAIMHLMAPGAKITFTTSVTRKIHNIRNLQLTESPRKFSQLGTYGRSKTALTHFVKYLAVRYPQFIINCADPGVVDSGMITMHRWYDPLADLFFRPFIRSPRQGAESTLRALTLQSSANIATAKSVSPISYDINSFADRELITKTLPLIDI